MIVDNGGDGVYLFRSNQAKIVGNHMVNNSDGLHLFIAHNNTISGNEMGENRNHGVYLSNSEDNNIFHNWLVENTRNVRVLESSGNMWDNGYPSGGNYWSDYAGIDEYTGPYQNLTGGDGLGDTPYIIDGVNQDRYPLMAPVRIHDIAVVDIGILSNEVYVGWMVEVDVSVENIGDYIESFSVTAYYNNTIMGTHTIHNLSVGASIIATFIWNTTSLPPCHNYILKAEATPVPDETNLEDNVYIRGHLKMKMVGDVNGDGKVDIRDITVVAMAFASHVGEPRYELKCDIKMDGVIDIRDITLAAMNFGLTCL